MIAVLMSVRAAPERPPSSPARWVVDRVAADGRIGGNDAVETGFHDHVHRRQELFVGQVGGEFDQDRHPALQTLANFVAPRRHPPEQRPQEIALLELAETRSVWTRRC